MKKAVIVGHFGFGYDYSDGQTIKTQNIYNALTKIYGEEQIKPIDTHGSITSFIKAPFILLKAFFQFKNIIILPAHRGLALITIFLGLKDVSVYAVYLLAINALRNLITNVGNSYQGALGKYNAEGNIEKLKTKFNQFDTSFLCISLIFFLTCLLLINPFVQLYTINVTDINYYRPNFALIIVLANLVYCIREPYRILVLALGKFKETNFGSMMEAILNLVISIVLLPKFGLLGVAIGTLCAVTYRLLYFIWFLKKDVFKRSYRSYLKNTVLTLIIIAVNIVSYYKIDLKIYSFGSFFLYGCVIIIVESLMVISLLLGWKNVANKAGAIFSRK